MKNFFGFLLLATLLTFAACGDDDDVMPIIPDPDPDPTEEVIDLVGDLSTQTLTADKQYLLKGQVFVRNGQVVTIEPGTVIFGDKRTRATLVVDRGGKIIADGTRENPIVMTSNQEEGVRDRGDWGGLVILGRASTNQVDPAVEGITPAVHFGGNPSNALSDNMANDNDDSGIYRYLRVEFGGIELTPNNETNSITMGGVGRGTVMEYNMVSFGGDDGFEWFGGTVNGKYFVSFCTWDDDFDMDYGWSGNVQYGLAIRYPGFADQSQSNGFECDNGPNDNDVEPYTTGTFSNITVIGPIKTGDRVSNNNYAHAIDLRRRTAISIFNSVFTGFPTGLRMNQPSVLGNYQAGRGVLVNNIMLTPRTQFAAGSGVDVADVEAVWTADNQLIEGPATDEKHSALGISPDLFFGSRLPDTYPSNPSLTVTSGTLTSGASFTNPKFSEANRAGFFDTSVNFIGGFGATDWTDSWAEFNPVNKVY